MSRLWFDMPRGWMMADLAYARAGTLKGFIQEAVSWGFDEPAGLTNNQKRVAWLQECRPRAWDILRDGGEPPAPGKPAEPPETTQKARRRRPAKPKARAPAPPVRTEAAGEPARDFFPSRSPQRGKRSARRRVTADLCEISAAECNAWLRSIPQQDPSGT